MLLALLSLLYVLTLADTVLNSVVDKVSVIVVEVFLGWCYALSVR